VELQKAVAEIDLRALSHNLEVVRKKTGNRSIMAVVKADAYGHGALEVSNHLIKKGISHLGVAFAGEAVALRESGIDVPITVFFDRDNIDEYIRYNLIPTVSDTATARKIDSAARRRRKKIPVHIKVDTGMGRIGFTMSSAVKDIARIASFRNILLEGLMSHFSDADLKDKHFAKLQLKNFSSLVASLKEKNVTFNHHHMANSAAVLSMPGAHLDMVRPGIMLYGYVYPGVRGLRPVLSLKSSILLLKTVPKGTPISYGRTFITKRRSTIATIPVGYADGYNRLLSNKGEVLIKGRRVPVVGRVCMDTIMVDVTKIPDVTYKSSVVLIGMQGKEKITADDIAEKTGTIPYEVLTSIGQRVKRVYKT
jgi:alanine racemase